MISGVVKTAACGLMVVATSLAGVRASEPIGTAGSYLVFEEIIDGKCQNLSAGGKLQVMLNAHPSRKIKFRLMRYFVDVRQNGRATGVAEPGGSQVKLGCTRVGGRVQRWVVERAEFAGDDRE